MAAYVAATDVLEVACARQATRVDELDARVAQTRCPGISAAARAAGYLAAAAFTLAVAAEILGFIVQPWVGALVVIGLVALLVVRQELDQRRIAAQAKHDELVFRHEEAASARSHFDSALQQVRAARGPASGPGAALDVPGPAAGLATASGPPQAT